MRTVGIVVFSLLPLIGFVVALQFSRGMLKPFEAPPKPADWGVHPDDREWEKEAVSDSHETLSRVSGTAKAWGESIAALLGIFSVVAFIKGPETVGDLDPLHGFITVGLILLAVLLAAVALILAELAAQGTPRETRQLDGWSLKQWQKARVKMAIIQTTWSRLLACCAVLALIAAMSVSWLISIDQADSTPDISVLLIDQDGGLHCVQAGKDPPDLGSGIVAAIKVDGCP